MLDKIRGFFKAKEFHCTECGKKIGEGEEFVANITMPKEKKMLVGRMDVTIAKTAHSILCKTCLKK